MLTKTKQVDILDKVLLVEEWLVKRFKVSAGETFGGKIKSIQSRIDNIFFVNGIWNMVQVRNNIVHKGNIEIGNDEYKLFISNFEYVKKTIKNIKLSK